MGQTRPLFVYFRSFSQHKDKYSTNFTINDKSIDGVLGSRTWGGMMEGADESTEGSNFIMERMNASNDLLDVTNYFITGRSFANVKRRLQREKRSNRFQVCPCSDASP